VLLGKKCLALRIAATSAEEGWLAEHMLILGLESPEGETHYVAAAFPSACGKTNLAMLVPPKRFQEGLEGVDGRRRHRVDARRAGRPALGHQPGGGLLRRGAWARATKTNPNAMKQRCTRTRIFTNVASRTTGRRGGRASTARCPSELIDWQGALAQGRREGGAPELALHRAGANSARRSRPAGNDPQGVPISAIIFGGRRATHGAARDSSPSTGTTASSSAPRWARRRRPRVRRKVGVVRRDPMAMLPFCGYNMGDRTSALARDGRRSPKPPRSSMVNWFRQDTDGKFLWPGFGENMRVLKWIVDRCRGGNGAVESPIGLLPADGAIDTGGLDVSAATMTELRAVSRDDWRGDVENIGEFFAKFGGHLPDEMHQQREALAKRIG
jgi:phosphoenolpyruvate carboxykinase (GTP)